MPFNENGFLGNDADQFVTLHRQQYSNLFNLAKRANRLAHEVLEKVQAHHGILHENVAIALYLRLLNSYASTVRLMEFGLGVDAGTVLRSCVESTVFLKKVAVEPAWAAEFTKASERKRLRFIKKIQADKTGHLDFLKTDPVKLQKALESLEAAGLGEGPSEFKVADIAPTVGLEGLYNTAYRDFSNSSTHSSAKSLEAHFDLDEEGKITGIKHTPLTDDYHLMFVVAGITLIVAMAALLQTFEPDPSKTQLLLEKIENTKLEFEKEAKRKF